LIADAATGKVTNATAALTRKVSRVFCAQGILCGRTGGYMAIYSNVPEFGLAKATERVPAVGGRRRGAPI
jgi:hypothetical protein